MCCDEWGILCLTTHLGLGWRKGELSDGGSGSCAVTSEVTLDLTTRLGMGSLDFRRRCAL